MNATLVTLAPSTHQRRDAQTHREEQTAAGSSARVLLIHPGALGDLIVALPAIAAVRAAYAGAPVALVVGDDLAGFAAEFPLFDALLPFDAARAYRGSRLAQAGTFAALAARARRWAPTRAGVFKPASAWAALARASGARHRAGLARGAGRRLLTHPIAVDPAQHHGDRYAAVARALGAPTGTAPVPWPRVPPPVAFSTRVTAARPLVAVAPGGARNAKQETPAKRWPAARFAAACAALRARRPDVRFVLLGAASDAAECGVVRDALPPDAVIDLTGATSIAQTYAVLGSVDVLVVNDSALLHVAGAAGTPVVAPFGPTDPRVLLPRATPAAAVWHPAHPAPCGDEVTGRARACVTPCCIERVAVADVVERVAAALGTRAPRAGRAASGQPQVLDVRVGA